MNNLIPDLSKNHCKACNGTGVQYNDKTGLKQRCPECRGSGRWTSWTEINIPTWKTRE